MPSLRSFATATYSTSSAARGWTALALFFGLGAACASGQTTWTGAAGDGKWTTGQNWSSGTVPTSAGQAVFDGQGQSMPISIVTSTFNGTTFTSGSYTFTYGGVNFTVSSLKVSGGTQTITSSTSFSSGALITVDAGATLIFAGNGNKFNGVTTFQGGGDYRIGSVTSSGGSLTMKSTGVLTLTGSSYSRPLTMESGTLSLGTSIAAHTFAGSVTLEADSTTALRLNGTSRGSTYDGLTLTGGALGYGGTLALNFGSTFADGDVLDLFSASTFTTNRSFSAITGTGTYAGDFTNNGGIWTMTSGDRAFTFTESTGDLSVAVVSAIPEPSTYAAVAGAGALGLALWRRRGRAV